MMKIADAMPEDKFGYKSTPAQRSYGEQVLHVATVNMALLGTIGGKAAAPARPGICASRLAVAALAWEFGGRACGRT